MALLINPNISSYTESITEGNDSGERGGWVGDSVLPRLLLQQSTGGEGEWEERGTWM